MEKRVTWTTADGIEISTSAKSGVLVVGGREYAATTFGKPLVTKTGVQVAAAIVVGDRKIGITVERWAECCAAWAKPQTEKDADYAKVCDLREEAEEINDSAAGTVAKVLAQHRYLDALDAYQARWGRK